MQADDTARSLPNASETSPDPRALLLLFGSVQDVLARIVPHDPLGLAQLVARALRDGAHLLDAEHVLRRAFIRCARSAPDWRGTPVLERWLADQVAAAVADVLRDERHLGSPGAAVPRSVVEALRWITEPLQLSPEAMRRACARFNGLGFAQRSALFAVLLEDASLDDVARSLDVSGAEAARLVREALSVFHEELRGDARRAS